MQKLALESIWDLIPLGGYWSAGFLGNVAFFVLFFKTLNSLLGEGNELSPMASFIIGSAILWIFTYIVTRGVKGAGVINAVATVAKLIPLVLVILLGIFLFNSSNFAVPNWQSVIAANDTPTTLISQIKGAMGTILWCFVGIEAAVVLSERAVSQKIVGKATVASLLITLGIYVSVSIIAMGVVDGKTLVDASTPLADVLGVTFIGGAGAIIVKLGIMISVMGATLPWIMLVAEIPYVAARDGVMPKWFAKTNENGIPINSLLLTQGLTQLFLVALLSDQLQSAYYMVYYISTSLILVPYLFSSLYSVKLCIEEKSFGKDFIISAIATIYAVFVVYAVGMMYLALTVIMYAIGVVPYFLAKRERGSNFTGLEKIIAILMIPGAIYLIFQIATGGITP